MHYRVKKFVNTAKNITSYSNMKHMPPSKMMGYLMDQIDRINKLVDATETEKREGTDFIWNLYGKVQSNVNKSGKDESWNMAESDGKGNWSSKNNKEVDFATLGDNFTTVIDYAVAPNPTTKVRRYDDD